MPVLAISDHEFSQFQRFVTDMAGAPVLARVLRPVRAHKTRP